MLRQEPHDCLIRIYGLIINEVVVVVVVVIGLMVKDTRILVVGPPKSWLRVPQKVMPRNPDKLAHAKTPRALFESRYLNPT